jgi:hypothetical protein
MMNFVIRTHRVTDNAPLATRLEMRLILLVLPELKYLNGNHRERAIPEYMIREIRLSRMLICIKLP